MESMSLLMSRPLMRAVPAEGGNRPVRMELARKKKLILILIVFVGNHKHCRCLPGPVVSKEGGDLALVEVQAQVLHSHLNKLIAKYLYREIEIFFSVTFPFE